MAITANEEQSLPRVSRSKPERMVSLDVLRGLTIAGMILVNSPGSWRYGYQVLAHAEWHGWTPTDLVFPFFLYVVGVAITLALQGRIARGQSQSGMLLHLLRRSAILFALGLFLNGFPNAFDPSTIRILGVLQRIALCYGLAALVFLKTRLRGQVISTAALLIGYWLMMTLVPVPGYGAGVLTQEGNLAAYIDRLLLSGHLLDTTWDPEGLLSTIPALGTTLLGVLTGHWMTSERRMGEKTSGLLVAGIVCVVLGEVWGLWFPINKNLWTSSFVLLSGGLALLLLAGCYWLVDGKGYRQFTKPLVIFGSNAIVVYMLSIMVIQLMNHYTFVLPNERRVSLRGYIYYHFFASWAGPEKGSLFFAIAYVLFWLAPMTLLYRKRIFIKI